MCGCMFDPKEPLVKKSIRLPLSLVAGIDEICEVNGLSFTEVVKQLILLGQAELERMDAMEKEAVL